MKPLLLGLDLGTTNVKAVLAEMDGRIVAQSAVRIALHHVGAAGVEQDIGEIWQAVTQAVCGAMRYAPGDKVCAIGISSQGGAMQLIDSSGKPVGRVVSWLDGRGRLDDEQFTSQQGAAWFRRQIRHECSGLALGQLRRIRRENPAWLQPPNRIGFVGDVITLRLCGRFVHDGTSAGLTLLYHPQRRQYASALLEKLGILESQLPEIGFGAAGRLLPSAAAEMSLPEGIPVSVPVHDQYAAALGSGAVHEGDVMLGAGTAWVLLAISSRLPKPAMPAALLCNHIVDELYGEILSLPAGGSSFTWALNLTGMAKEAPERIEEKLAQVKPGCEGLVFWPFLAGTKPPGLERGVLGRLSGVQLAHGAGHVLRAVVEGLAFELNRHLDMLRCSGISIRRLVMCGGAAQSKVTTQILADVTGVAVACCPSDGGSLLGAVVLARSLLEPASSIKDLALAMLSPTNLVEPGVDASEYRKRYQSYLESLPVRKKGGAAVRPGRIAGQKGGGKEDR